MNEQNDITGQFFVGEIPEHLRPPAPSDLVHSPCYPWHSPGQLRHFVNSVFDEVMREREQAESEDTTMSDEQELATGGVIEDTPIMNSETQGEELAVTSLTPGSGVTVNYTINGWSAPFPNPTLLNPSGMNLLPGWNGGAAMPLAYPQPAQQVMFTTNSLTEPDIRAMVARWLREDAEIRAILSEAVDEHLEALAKAMREDPALPSPMARGIDENGSHFEE